jgi:sulfur dioxygenase
MRYSTLSCEQVYKIWATDPHLIRVLDLRSEDEFQRAHVPGAIRIAPQQLRRELDQLSGRLAVVVAAEELAEEVGLELSDREDAVLMNQCHRWMELQHPIAGDGLKATILELKRRSGMGTTKALLENGTVFHQLFEPESSTYTYIIADRNTKEAAIIDPVLETVDRDLKLIDELGLRLVYVLDTHIHADHITGAGEIRKRTDAKTAVSRRANVDCVDIALEDGQELTLGNKKIKVIATPGHTDTCLTFGFEGMIFTGDALLIRGCGRTDFQQGSADDLYDSVHEKLFQLPDDTVVYPGHDYRGLTSTTIGLEKAHNPRLGLKNSREEFKKIMSELKLANPKKIHEAVPANLACGRPKDSRVLHPQIVDGIPEVTVDDVLRHLPDAEAGRVKLIDVRRPDEFNGELGHIKGAKLVTLGPDLTKFLENGNRAEEIVFVCRSGGRSGTAAAESIKLGYKFTINMVGGMIRWNEKKFKTENN